MSGVPIRTQLFDSFLGEQEGIHAIILPDIFSSGGSKNLWIDKYGRAKKILGYSQLNAAAVTTDTGASATRCRALYPYRKTSGGSTTRQLLGIFDDAANEYELHYSTDDGATWTFIADFGAGSINSIPDFGQMGDTLIITNGVVAPYSWNGTALTTAGSTQSPALTTAAGGAGNLIGNYKWKLVSVFTSGARKAGSDASTVLPLQSLSGSLTWTADADLTVAGYEVYRTTGTGEVYYFESYVDGRTTAAYTSNTDDFAIIENRILEEHGDPPPSGAYYCVPHKQRMWYLRTDTLPQAGYWSDPGLPDSVLTESNYLQFSDAAAQGDVITGGIGDYEGLLIVFEEHSIWSVAGTGQVIGNIVDWTRQRTNAQIGTVSHRTVARIPAGSKYTDQNGAVQMTNVATLAYLTPLLDIRIFDGDNDIIISFPKKTQLSELNYSQRHKSFVVQDITRGEVTWCYPSGSDGEPSAAVTWNYRWGVWYEREWPFGHAIPCDSASSGSILVAGESSTTIGGLVYLLWDGATANGTPFRAQWMTKTLYGVNEQGQPCPSHRKRWRWAEMLFETEQTTTLTIEWLQGDSPDNGAAIGQDTFSPGTASILSADGDTIVSADGDTVLLSSASSMVNVKLMDSSGHHLHHRGIRLRIYDEAAQGSWSLEAFSLAYQILEGMKRRSGAVL